MKHHDALQDRWIMLFQFSSASLGISETKSWNRKSEVIVRTVDTNDPPYIFSAGLQVYSLYKRRKLMHKAV